MIKVFKNLAFTLIGLPCFVLSSAQGADPLSVAGLQAWFSSDTAVVYDSITKKISKWNDLSGNNNNAQQTTVAYQPIFVDSIDKLNLHPAFRFDGINDFFQLDNPLNIQSAFFVFKYNGGLVAADYQLVLGSLDDPPRYISIIEINTTTFRITGETHFTNYYINSVNTNDLSPMDKFKIVYGSAPSPQTINSVQIGISAFVLFAAGMLKADVAEVIAYNRTLTNPERLSIEQYLRDKYAPPVNLGPDINSSSICDTTLDASSRFISYKWHKGNDQAIIDTNRLLTVNKPGKYWVEVTDFFGFPSSDTVYVTYPFNQIPDSSTTCLGDTFVWNTNLSASSFSFLWSNGSTDSLLKTTQAGPYSVVVTEAATSCVLNSDTVHLSIDSFPAIAKLGNDTSLCAGNFIGLQQGENLATGYLWSTGDTTSAIQVFTSGNYSVSVQDMNGCSKLDTISVVISGSSPLANFSATSFCEGSITHFFDSSTDTSGNTIVSWLWDFGDLITDTVQNPSHLYSGDGSYHASLLVTSNSGCSQISEKDVTIHSLPLVLFSTSTSFCQTDSILFFDNTNPSPDTTISWLWSFDDPNSGINNSSVLKNPAHLFIDTARNSFNVSLTITTNIGCQDSAVKLLNLVPASRCFNPNQIAGLQTWLSSDAMVVYDSVSKKVSAWNDISGHDNHAQQINPTYQPLFIDSVDKLNFHPAMRFDGINDHFQLDTTIDIQSAFFVFKYNGGLVASDYQLILGSQDDPPRYISLVEINTTLFRDAGETFFTNYYINTNNTINLSPMDKFKIVYGSAPAMQSINSVQIGISAFIQFAAGMLNGDVAEIIVYNRALEDSERVSVENYLRYKYAPPVDLGSDINMITLCDTMLDASPRFISYLWHKENDLAFIDTNQTFLENKSGKYWIEVTDAFGFTSTDTVNISYPIYQPEQNIQICFGDTFHWSTNLNPADFSFLWSDNSTDSSLDMFIDGKYYVNVTENSTGCIFTSDTVVLSVDSFPFIASLGNDSISLCVGNSIGLVQGANQATNYLWSTNDTTPTIPIQVSGNYSLFVSDNNGCSKTDSIYATIIGNPPVAQFTSTSGCLGTATQLFDSSYDPAIGNSVVSWLWNFDDATSDTLQNPSHTFLSSGYHSVVLTVLSNLGCADQDTAVIFVHHLPLASFTNGNPCTINDIQFNSTSAIAAGDTINGWSWNFGNPSSGSNTSVSQNPTHKFDTTGNFVVSLIATTTSGCSDTAFSVLQVKRASRPIFQYLPTCFGDLVQFTNLSTPALLDTAWNWNFGDNSGQSPFENPAHYYAFAQTYTVTFTVYASTGCVTTASLPVTVSPIPVANFVHATACVNTPYQFIDSSYIAFGSITGWNWNIAGLKTDTLRNSVYTFTDTGYYSIVHTVKSDIGCSKTMTRNIYVNPKPVANFSFSPQFGNPPLLVSFNNLTSNLNSNTYNWSFGDGSGSSFVHPQHQYNDTSLYTIKLVATNTIGCPDSAEKSINVNKPVLDLAVMSLNSSYISNNHLHIKVDLANLGTRTINNFKIEAQLEEGTAIRESFTMSLPTGYSGQIELTSSLDLGSGQSNYYCVRAVEPNETTDDLVLNDERCKNLSNDFSVPNPYPNPFTDQLILQMILPYKGEISIEIFDMIGKNTMIYEGIGLEGLNQFEKSFGDWSGGTYGIRFKFKESEIIKTIIKIEQEK